MHPLLLSYTTRPEGSLFFQTELLDERSITALIVRLEITEVYAAISDHLKKAAAGMEILWVLLQVLGELVNLF